jgi:hypothetical protein
LFRVRKSNDATYVNVDFQFLGFFRVSWEKYSADDAAKIDCERGESWRSREKAGRAPVGGLRNAAC